MYTLHVSMQGIKTRRAAYCQINTFKNISEWQLNSDLCVLYSYVVCEYIRTGIPSDPSRQVMMEERMASPIPELERQPFMYSLVVPRPRYGNETAKKKKGLLPG